MKKTKKLELEREILKINIIFLNLFWFYFIIILCNYRTKK